MSKDEGKEHAKESHDEKPAASAEGGEEGSLEASFAESKKKAKKKKMIIGAAALVVLLGGGGAGAFFSGAFGGSKTGDATAEGHGEAAPADAHGSAKTDAHGGEGAGKEGEAGVAKPAFFQLGDILVNLSGDSKRPNFLKISITLELANEKDSAEMTAIKPRIIDNFQVYLRELRVEDLRGSAGLYRLREELLLRINEVAAPIRVRDILFQELLVQ